MTGKKNRLQIFTRFALYKICACFQQPVSSFIRSISKESILCTEFPYDVKLVSSFSFLFLTSIIIIYKKKQQQPSYKTIIHIMHPKPGNGINYNTTQGIKHYTAQRALRYVFVLKRFRSPSFLE